MGGRGRRGDEEKRGSRGPVGAISSVAERANWEVGSLICSAAPVASSINSLVCACVCVHARTCGLVLPERFVFLPQLPPSIIMKWEGRGGVEEWRWGLAEGSGGSICSPGSEYPSRGKAGGAAAGKKRRKLFAAQTLNTARWITRMEWTSCRLLPALTSGCEAAGTCFRTGSSLDPIQRFII